MKSFSRFLAEKLDPSRGAGSYIHDFVHSNNPRFKGKDRKKRIRMALGAFYSDLNNADDSVWTGVKRESNDKDGSSGNC